MPESRKRRRKGDGNTTDLSSFGQVFIVIPFLGTLTPFFDLGLFSFPETRQEFPNVPKTK